MRKMVEATRALEPKAPDAGFAPLEKLADILRELDRAEVRYCHWKSNYHIRNALSGKEDLDLLVEKQDFAKLARVLLQHGFKEADSITSRRQPGVFHFLGNDEATGTLVNVHAYARILTGDHLLKSWALPVERLLLSDTQKVHGIRLPSKAAELIVFVLRNMLKHTTVFDLYFGWRSHSAMREECQWLVAGARMEDCLRNLAAHLPMISPRDFQVALDLIGTEGAIWRRIRMGFRFRRALAKHRRYAPVRRAWETFSSLGRLVIRRLGKNRKTMTFRTGGTMIALVGPQATGKSTLAEAVRRWLGRELSVWVIHAGKPPATLVSFLPNTLIPLARRLFPGQMTRTIDEKVDHQNDYRVPCLYLLRKLLLAHDRRKLLRRAYRRSRNGQIVICDRYPSDNPGAIDGASFRAEMIEAQTSPLKRLLMRWENRIYRDICSPDLVLELSVPIEEAMERNLVRNKDRPQDTEYVRQRHAVRHKPRFDTCPVVPISTDQDPEETLLEVKRAIWRHL